MSETQQAEITAAYGQPGSTFDYEAFVSKKVETFEDKFSGEKKEEFFKYLKENGVKNVIFKFDGSGDSGSAFLDSILLSAGEVAVVKNFGPDIGEVLIVEETKQNDDDTDCYEYRDGHAKPIHSHAWNVELTPEQLLENKIDYERQLSECTISNLNDVARPVLKTSESFNDDTKSWDKTESMVPKKLYSEIEDLAYEALSVYYGGWEINEGSFGQLIFDVEDKVVRVSHYQRVSREEHSELEL